MQGISHKTMRYCNTGEISQKLPKYEISRFKQYLIKTATMRYETMKYLNQIIKSSNSN